MSYKFLTELLIMLENVIKDFLDLCSLFSDKLSLSVKFHYLVHYPRMIRVLKVCIQILKRKSRIVEIGNLYAILLQTNMLDQIYLQIRPKYKILKREQ